MKPNKKSQNLKENHKVQLSEKLEVIQSELEVPKGQLNKFGGYKYRSCEDILSAVKPFLAKHKVFIKLTDEVKQIGERYYVVAEASIVDAEVPEQQITVTAFAREDEVKKGMDASQITGSASSYARKYALNGLLAIDDTKDPDATNVVKCENCHKVIEGHGGMTGAQIMYGTKKTYGKALCYECGIKAKQEKEENERKKAD